MKTGSGSRIFLLVLANLLAFGLAWLGWRTRTDNLLGWFLLLLGMAYALGSLLSALALIFLLLPALFYRLSVEEDLLTEQYGDAYLQYAVRTPRLIPGLF